MTSRSLLVALLLPLASAPAQSTVAPGDCAPIAIDTARFGSAPVYAACQVQSPAKLKRASEPSVKFPDGVQCLVAELEFVVDEMGAPVRTTAVILNATTLPYAAAVLDRLSEWRYAPAERNGAPVRQLVVGRLAMKDGGRRVPFVARRPGEPAPSLPPEPPAPPCK